MTRPTRRGLGLCGTSGLLLLVGTNVQAGWLFGIASLLLGVVIAGWLMPRGMLKKVEVERDCPPEAFAGEEVPVDLIVRNKSHRAKLNLVVEDPLIAPCTAFVPTLPAGGEVIVGTRRHAARRGIVDASELRVWSDAPFGVAAAQRKLAAPGRLVIFPRVVEIERLPALASAAKPLEEATMRARKGTGHDFMGIREYKPGDALRHVHWPSSARHSDLMVREFEQELPRRLGILIDTWADTGTGEEESALDVCCSVAASISLNAVTDGHPVALAAAREGEMDSIEAAVSNRTSLTWLAGLVPTAGPPMPVAAESALKVLGRVDTLVLAFPTWRPNSAEAMGPVVAALDATGVQVVAAIVEADSFEPPSRPSPVLTADEIDQLTSAMAASGAAVDRIRAKENLAACLQRPAAG